MRSAEPRVTTSQNSPQKTTFLNWIASCNKRAQEEHMEAVTQMEMETITSVWTRRDAVALVALVTFVSLAAYWLAI